ncbi:MAG: tRNA (cytidine(34)-2'-O)-methyltransferase [Thermoanaerobaculia bacterium]|nr:tRNA (cytidine(34)-2'-O)-methyltransferase [Thermoanaerobaculia bacterium]
MSSRESSLHVVLVHPEIPGNTGNVGRTCLAAGAELHLVEPLGFSLDDNAVRRAGLDYWPSVDPTVWPDWSELESRLPELGEPFFFSVRGETGYWEPRYPRNAVLIFGGESDGLEPKIRSRYHDRLLRIPVRDDAVRSLNLSCAVALALYEVRRQLTDSGP